MAQQMTPELHAAVKAVSEVALTSLPNEGGVAHWHSAVVLIPIDSEGRPVTAQEPCVINTFGNAPGGLVAASSMLMHAAEHYATEGTGNVQH